MSGAYRHPYTFYYPTQPQQQPTHQQQPIQPQQQQPIQPPPPPPPPPPQPQDFYQQYAVYAQFQQQQQQQQPVLPYHYDNNNAPNQNGGQQQQQQQFQPQQHLLLLDNNNNLQKPNRGIYDETGIPVDNKGGDEEEEDDADDQSENEDNDVDSQPRQRKRGRHCPPTLTKSPGTGKILPAAYTTIPKPHKKKSKRYPRHEWSKSQERRRLQAAREVLEDAQQCCDESKAVYEAAQLHLEKCHAAYQQTQDSLVDVLLEKERDRAWNKMYQQLQSFSETKGHCLIASRGSTRQRQQQQRKKSNTTQNNKKQIQHHPQEEKDNSNDGTTTAGNDSCGDEEGNSKGSVLLDSDQGGNNIDTKEDGNNNNNVDDPVDWNDDDMDKLGRWIVKQRAERKLGKVEPWKITAMDRLGFVWDSRDVSWRENYQKLKEFYAKHGHVKVPTSTDYSLQRWLKFQRACYAEFKERDFQDPEEGSAGMTMERCRLLEAMGVDWLDADARWIVLFNKLKAFYQSQGHWKAIPRNHVNLIEFVDNQRKAYDEYTKGGNLDTKDMTAERVALLETIHFPWSEPGQQRAKSTSSKSRTKAINKTNNKDTNTVATAPLDAIEAADAHLCNGSSFKCDDWWLKYIEVKKFFAKYQHFKYTEEPAEPEDLMKSLHQWDSVQRRLYSEFYEKPTGKASLHLTPERHELLMNLGFFQTPEKRVSPSGASKPSKRNQ